MKIKRNECTHCTQIRHHKPISISQTKHTTITNEPKKPKQNQMKTKYLSQPKVIRQKLVVRPPVKKMCKLNGDCRVACVCVRVENYNIYYCFLPLLNCSFKPSKQLCDFHKNMFEKKECFSKKKW